MSVATLPEPPQLPNAPLARFTVERYEELTRRGLFDSDDKFEMIDGYLVEKKPQNDPHIVAVDLLSELFLKALPAEWTIRCQFGIRLAGSVPEPDGVIVPGPKTRYRQRKPVARDVALVIEVSNTTLRYDRTTKLKLYARNRLPIYWIVNVGDEVVEVYSDPKAGKEPGYRARADYGRGSKVPIVLRGETVAEIEVDAIFA